MASRHSQLVQATLTYLTSLQHEVFPVKNLATPHLKGGKVTWSRGQLKPGVADVCGCSKDGTFLAVEVKVGRDVLRPEQKRFAYEVKRRGGMWLEVRDTTQALIEAHARGEI